MSVPQNPTSAAEAIDSAVFFDAMASNKAETDDASQFAIQCAEIFSFLEANHFSEKTQQADADQLFTSIRTSECEHNAQREDSTQFQTDALSNKQILDDALTVHGQVQTSKNRSSFFNGVSSNASESVLNQENQSPACK